MKANLILGFLLKLCHLGLGVIGGQGLLNLRYMDPNGKTLQETSRALLNLAATLQQVSFLVC